MWNGALNHFAQTEQICQDIIKWKKIEDTFIMSTLNVSFISLFISDISACFYISCFVFFAEEERRVRGNDREYNEKFQYAVSHKFSLYSHTFNLYLLPIPPPSSLFLSAEQLHHDLKVQHHHLPTSQPV